MREHFFFFFLPLFAWHQHIFSYTLTLSYMKEASYYDLSVPPILSPSRYDCKGPLIERGLIVRNAKKVTGNC